MTSDVSAPQAFTIETTRTSPRVAVVMVNANAGDFLDQALSCLARQTFLSWKTIVVDNASTDGSVDGIEERHPGVEVIRLSDNVGFAAANNLGVRAAGECELIALLNPDAFPEPDWLAALVRAAEAASSYSSFGSQLLRVTAPGEIEELDATALDYHVSGRAWQRDHGMRVDAAPAASDEIFSPCAAAAMYRRDAFLEAGGFDESYFCYLEDVDLGFRLRLLGHRSHYVPDAVVRHIGSAIAGPGSSFAVYHSQRNAIWTYFKDMPSPLVWVYLPYHLLANILAVIRYVIQGQGRAVVTAKLDAGRGLGRILRERRAVQATRSVGALELRRVMARGFFWKTRRFLRNSRRMMAKGFLSRTRKRIRSRLSIGE